MLVRDAVILSGRQELYVPAGIYTGNSVAGPQPKKILNAGFQLVHHLGGVPRQDLAFVADRLRELRRGARPIRAGYPARRRRDTAESIVARSQ